VLPFVSPQQLSQVALNENRVVIADFDSKLEVMDWYENVVQTSGYWVALSQLTGDCYVNCGARAIALAYSGVYSLSEHLTTRDVEYIPISPHVPVYRYVFAHTPQVAVVFRFRCQSASGA